MGFSEIFFRKTAKIVTMFTTLKLKLLIVTLLLCVVAARGNFDGDYPSIRRYISFNEPEGPENEIVASNCSCGSCTNNGIDDSSESTRVCQNFTRSDILHVIQAAESASTPTWIYISELTICCNSLSSESARLLLIDLLDYVSVTSLELNRCDALFPPETSKDITLYNLTNLTIIVQNKMETLDLIITDQTNPRLIETYFLRNVAFLSTNVLNLNSPLKAFSFIADRDPNALTEILTAAFDRAPFKNVTLPVQSVDFVYDAFLVTPIYV